MINDILLNFKQGRIADTRENVEMIQQKVEQHENQITQQTVFSKVESLEAEDNLYHMTISVNDGSGSLEVVDKADEDTSDGKMSVVGLNMYKSSIASLMNEKGNLTSNVDIINVSKVKGTGFDIDKKKSFMCRVNGEVQLTGNEIEMNTIYYEDDASNFGDTNLLGMIFANNKFVRVGNNVCKFSYDGINWSDGTIPEGNYTSIAYGTPIEQSSSSGVSVSTWRYVAVGDNVAAYSTDGINFTSGTIPEGNYTSIAYGNEKYVAVGHIYLNDEVNYIVAYSTDGINFTSGTTPVNSYYYLKYVNDRFMALSYSNICYSTDGITFTEATIPETEYDIRFYDVVYGNNKYVATGEVDGHLFICYSTDGMTFTKSTYTDNSYTYDPVYNIIYAENKFIVVSGEKDNEDNLKRYKGLILVSEDGITFNRIDSNSTYNQIFMNIIYGNNRYVIGVNCYDVNNMWIDESYICYSNDLITFNYVNIIDGNFDLSKPMYGNNVYVMSNSFGCIQGLSFDYPVSNINISNEKAIVDLDNYRFILPILGDNHVFSSLSYENNHVIVKFSSDTHTIQAYLSDVSNGIALEQTLTTGEQTFDVYIKENVYTKKEVDNMIDKSRTDMKTFITTYGSEIRAFSAFQTEMTSLLGSLEARIKALEEA